MSLFMGDAVYSAEGSKPKGGCAMDGEAERGVATN